MRPGERYDAVQRIASPLDQGSTADDNRATEILAHFGVESPGFVQNYDTVASFVVWSLTPSNGVSDETIEELDRYLSGEPPPWEPQQPASNHPGVSDPFKPGTLRIFASHIYAERHHLMQVKTFVTRYGIDMFVAHEDIEPSDEWLLTIKAALTHCDALVAFLHDGFPESKWCDQEVGFAVGLRKPVISVRFDSTLEPHGFLAQHQALTLGKASAADDGRLMFQTLVRNAALATKVLDPMVTTLVEADSFDAANRAAKALMASQLPLTADHIARLEAALEQNSQVKHGFESSRIIPQLRAEFDLRHQRG